MPGEQPAHVNSFININGLSPYNYPIRHPVRVLLLFLFKQRYCVGLFMPALYCKAKQVPSLFDE